jgi:signal transduction histidine kinase
MRRFALVLWPAAVVLGVAAEWTAYELEEVRHWLPDLVVGWTFLFCGLVAWSRRRESRTGLLLAGTGLAWFAGNFAEPLVTLHRGPLVHCVLAYPSGRLRSRGSRAAVAAAYAAALVAPLGRSGIATIVLAALVVGVAARDYRQTVGRERRARFQSLQAASALGLGLAGVAAMRLALPDAEANEELLLAYEVTLVAITVGLLIGLLRAPWERAAVTDLVVELGDASSGTLRDALARALGDPTLRVGYWLAETGGYVDGAGEQLELPEPASARAVTSIERDGRPLAVLIHDPAVLDDPGLVEGVAAAARLAAANARLQVEVRAKVAELEASRRRLLDASDEERRRLELRLREGAACRLEGLGGLLATARSAPGSSSGDLFGQAQRQLERALDDLHELARGLHPRELVEEGLERAVKGLADRSRVPVDVNVSAGQVGAEAEAAAYFLCSEALANVAKYAAATRIAIRITQADGRLEVAVADDGSGGADPARGFGLRGLADRVEVLGGTLRVDSPPGGGTRIEATIPIEPSRAGVTPGHASGRIDR